MAGRKLTRDEAKDLLRKKTGWSKLAVQLWLLMIFDWPPGPTREDLERELRKYESSPNRKRKFHDIVRTAEQRRRPTPPPALPTYTRPEPEDEDEMSL